MFYGLHTTTRAERELLLGTEGEIIDIDPTWFQKPKGNKPIVIEEGGKTYEHSPDSFLDLLENIDKDPGYDVTESEYAKSFFYKFHDVRTRILNLPTLLQNIRLNGIISPVECEITGERIDGSFRTKIALYLGIESVKAVLHRFHWSQITEDFIERKLKARWLSSGKDYYEFEYGYKDWKNVPNGGEVYRENADKAETIIPLITGKTVLDVGCNEGYISIQAARKGHVVQGIDLEWNHIAYLNKLIFEFIDKKDIPVEFFKEDLLKTQRTADTILMLNVLYHIPKDRQEKFLRRFDGKQLILQCNLRKEKERENYYTSHPDDLIELLGRLGRSYKRVEFADKPIFVC